MKAGGALTTPVFQLSEAKANNNSTRTDISSITTATTRSVGAVQTAHSFFTERNPTAGSGDPWQLAANRRRKLLNFYRVGEHGTSSDHQDTTTTSKSKLNLVNSYSTQSSSVDFSSSATVSGVPLEGFDVDPDTPWRMDRSKVHFPTPSAAAHHHQELHEMEPTSGPSGGTGHRNENEVRGKNGGEDVGDGDEDSHPFSRQDSYVALSTFALYVLFSTGHPQKRYDDTVKDLSSNLPGCGLEFSPLVHANSLLPAKTALEFEQWMSFASAGSGSGSNSSGPSNQQIRDGDSTESLEEEKNALIEGNGKQQPKVAAISVGYGSLNNEQESHSFTESSETPKSVNSSTALSPTFGSREQDINFRVFAPSRRLQSFTMLPLVPWKLLHRLTTAKWWQLVFLVVCVVAELAIFLPRGHYSAYLYMIGTCLSGTLMWLHVSQYSRGLVLQCLRTFDFWYQVVSFTILLTCNTYGVTVAYGSSLTIAPHAYQGLALGILVFAMDASAIGGRLFRGLVNFYYGVVILGVFFEWRFYLKERSDRVVNLHFTTFLISSVAEAAALTCGFFCVRSFFKIVFRKKVTTLLNFELREARSQAERLHIARHVEFCVAITTDRDASTEIRHVASRVTKQIPNATIHLVDSSPDAIRRRCFCPTATCWSLDSAPLVANQRVARLTKRKFWDLCVFLAVGNLLFALIPLPYRADDPSAVLALLICRNILQLISLMVFLCHFSQYSRGVIRCVFWTFDFLFLGFQAAVLLGFNFYRTYRVTDSMITVILSLCAWASFFAVMFWVDASPYFSRRKKAVLYGLFAIIQALEIASWRFRHSEISDAVVGFWHFDTTVGSVAQGSAFTIGAYCCRYMYNLLGRKADTVLTFDCLEVNSMCALDEELKSSQPSTGLKHSFYTKQY